MDLVLRIFIAGVLGGLIHVSGLGDHPGVVVVIVVVGQVLAVAADFGRHAVQ